LEKCSTEQLAGSLPYSPISSEGRARRQRRSLTRVCRACSTVWRWKSSTQPDGGEGLAKRKGVTVRWGLKEARSKSASRWTKTEYEAWASDEWPRYHKVHIHQGRRT